LDGIAPDLYNCLTPQSLALHEAIADLTALLVALRSRELRARLLEQTNGSISGKNAYSLVAEQFGFERDQNARSSHLRSLWNEKNLNPADESLDELNRRNRVSRSEPHLLSEVLSGALYRVLAGLHDEYRSRHAVAKQISSFSASGGALFAATEHFKRLVLRSLDYLPPGEVSFADYGRAILAADKASYEADSTGRTILTAEFARRHIVADPSELDVRTNFDHDAVKNVDLETLVASDWAAYEFANREREFLGIPPGVNFRVRPRLRAKKKYWTRDGLKPVVECVFKVSWDRLEDNPRDLPIQALRQITVGATLVVDWETRRVRALIASQAAMTANATPADAGAADQQREDRDAMLRKLVATRQLSYGQERVDEPQFATAARAEVSGHLIRIRGTARMLHLIATDAAEQREGYSDG
jgi:hypothetical protein